MDDIGELFNSIPRNIGACTLEELVEIGKKLYKFEKQIRAMDKRLYNSMKTPLNGLKSSIKFAYKRKLFRPRGLQGMEKKEIG